MLSLPRAVWRLPHTWTLPPSILAYPLHDISGCAIFPGSVEVKCRRREIARLDPVVRVEPTFWHGAAPLSRARDPSAVTRIARGANHSEPAWITLQKNITWGLSPITPHQKMRRTFLYLISGFATHMVPLRRLPSKKYNTLP